MPHRYRNYPYRPKLSFDINIEAERKGKGFDVRILNAYFDGEELYLKIEYQNHKPFKPTGVEYRFDKEDVRKIIDALNSGKVRVKETKQKR